MSLVDFAQFVEDLATVSGQAILPFFRTHIGHEDKSGGAAFDPVTEADRAGEVAMRRMINAQFPDHGINGEEYGIERPDADYVWVLDPIDGTRAFISGIPLWGTLIGLTHKGRPAYGMMHQPYIGERFLGDGNTAHSRGPTGEKRLMSRSCRSLSEAIMMTTSPALFSGKERECYDMVESKVKLARYSTDCYAYCMLAAGHVDFVVESGLKPYDIVALIPIIEGAGGIVTSWSGGSAASGGQIIASGDPKRHDEVLALLRHASNDS